MRNGRFWTILGVAMCLLFGTAGAALAWLMGGLRF